jgi:hypothetical protein
MEALSSRGVEDMHGFGSYRGRLPRCLNILVWFRRFETIACQMANADLVEG